MVGVPKEVVVGAPRVEVERRRGDSSQEFSLSEEEEASWALISTSMTSVRQCKGFIFFMLTKKKRENEK